MARNFGSPSNKDPFEDLDSDFKDAIAQSSPEDINKRISKVAQDEVENQRMQSEDQDLAEKKNEVKVLAGPYDKKTKLHASRIGAVTRVLKDKDLKLSTTTVEELNSCIAEAAKAEMENQEAKKADPDLESAKEEAKLAAEGYKEATKMNALRIAYCRRVLSDKGQA